MTPLSRLVSGTADSVSPDLFEAFLLHLLYTTTDTVCVLVDMDNLGLHPENAPGVVAYARAKFGPACHVFMFDRPAQAMTNVSPSEQEGCRTFSSESVFPPSVVDSNPLYVTACTSYMFSTGGSTDRLRCSLTCSDLVDLNALAFARRGARQQQYFCKIRSLDADQRRLSTGLFLDGIGRCRSDA